MVVHVSGTEVGAAPIGEFLLAYSWKKLFFKENLLKGKSSWLETEIIFSKENLLDSKQKQSSQKKLFFKENFLERNLLNSKQKQSSQKEILSKENLNFWSICNSMSMILDTITLEL